jgi:hypothetical protein
VPEFENSFNASSLLSEEDLQILLEESENPCVSIYMPTPELGREKRKHPIKLKNLLRKAEQKLQESNLKPSSVKDFMEPAQKLITDSDYWRTKSAAIGVFIKPDWFRTLSLPLECEEIVVVSDRFHLKPILPLLSSGREYCVLALSQNQVKCFHCTPYSIHEVELANVPLSLAEALKYDDPEKQLQFHTQTSGIREKNQRSAMFHGHGKGIDDSKNDILRFFRMVEKGLQSLPILKQKPLILAGVEYLHSIYRTVNTNPYLLETGITGNIEKLSEEQLHEKSWSVANAAFKQKRREEFSRYRELSGSDLAYDDIRKIVPAAYEGKIDTLFVAAGFEQWGHFDAQMQAVTLGRAQKPGIYDLTDYAAVHTYLKGGKVYILEAVEIPDTNCAAILRY